MKKFLAILFINLLLLVNANAEDWKMLKNMLSNSIVENLDLLKWKCIGSSQSLSSSWRVSFDALYSKYNPKQIINNGPIVCSIGKVSLPALNKNAIKENRRK